MSQENAHEGAHRVMSVEEERAIQEADREMAALDTALGALAALAPDPAAAWEHQHAADMAIAGWHVASVATIHARLCRLAPHLSDLIALGCWPETFSPPPWTDAGGAPMPPVYPAGALTRIRGGE